MLKYLDWNRHRIGQNSKDIKDCQYCSRNHKQGYWPAFKEWCNWCGALNHFEIQCLSRKLSNSKWLTDPFNDVHKPFIMAYFKGYKMHFLMSYLFIFIYCKWWKWPLLYWRQSCICWLIFGLFLVEWCGMFHPQSCTHLAYFLAVASEFLACSTFKIKNLQDSDLDNNLAM